MAAIRTPSPALGQPFIPVTPLPHVSAPAETLEAWCAYLNSTPAVVSFLNRRQKALDYSDYSLEQLRSIPVPDPAKCDLTPLEDAFRDLGDAESLASAGQVPNPRPIRRRGSRMPRRRPQKIADWRERIVREPTVCHRPADPFEYPRDFVSLLTSGPSLEGLDLERDRSPMRDVEL